MKSVWTRRGNELYLGDVTAQTTNLEPQVYRLDAHFTMSGCTLFLEHVSENFHIPYKVYDTSTAFRNRVIKTWQNTPGNLGLLLNGIRGTGKTSTAQMLCNEMQLPVILVNNNFPGITEWINSIQEEVIIFFDEFEKNFKITKETKESEEKDGTVGLLTLMDGVMKSKYRKMFLLTTNNPRLNENFLQRPGRLRYVKPYGNLTIPEITTIVQDKLQGDRAQYIDATVKFVATLNIITIDIVTAICDEVNIHNEAPEAFADVFNVERIKKTMTSFKIELTSKGEPKKVKGQTIESYHRTYQPAIDLNELEIGQELYFGGHWGEIESIDVGKMEIKTDRYGTKHLFRFEEDPQYNETFRSHKFDDGE